RRLGVGRSLLIELTIEGAALRGRAVLHVPELALRAVALGAPESRLTPGPATAQLRLGFSPPIPRGVIWAHALTGISGAGVALPGARLVDGCLQGPLWLVRSGIWLRGTLGPDGFRHDAVEMRSSSLEVTHVDPALSELPVELEVELARVPLSLA